MPYLATESRRSSGWHYFHLSSFGAFYSSFVLIWNFRHFHLLQSWNRTNQFSLWCTGCSLTPQWLTGGSILIFKLCHFHLDLLGQMLHHHQRCYCISQICLCCCGFNEIGPSFKLTMRNNKFIKSLSFSVLALFKSEETLCVKIKVAFLI